MLPIEYISYSLWVGILDSTQKNDTKSWFIFQVKNYSCFLFKKVVIFVDLKPAINYYVFKARGNGDKKGVAEMNKKEQKKQLIEERKGLRKAIAECPIDSDASNRMLNRIIEINCMLGVL